LNYGLSPAAFAAAMPRVHARFSVSGCPRWPPAYGRQIERAAEIVHLIGYVAGSLPGQRLLARLAIATGDDMVLQRLREKPSEEVAVTPIGHQGGR
jgi:hypothetical protein